MRPMILGVLALSLAAGGTLTADEGKAGAKKALYERIGGEKALKQVIDDFVATAAVDPNVDFTRGGTWKATDAAVAHLKLMLFEFMGQAFGGPQKYSGASMQEAHRGMAITQAQFDAIAGHLKAALAKNKVPEAEAGEIMAIAASTAPEIIEKK